jgi:hypothetical protein
VLTAPNDPHSKRNKKKKKRVTNGATGATEGSDADDGVATSQNTIALLREQIRSNRALLTSIDEHDAKDADTVPTIDTTTRAGLRRPLSSLDDPDMPSASIGYPATPKGKKTNQEKKKKTKQNLDRPERNVSARKGTKRSEANPKAVADTGRSILRPPRTGQLEDDQIVASKEESGGTSQPEAPAMTKTDKQKKKAKKLAKKKVSIQETARATGISSSKPPMRTPFARTPTPPLAQHLPDPNVTPIAEDADDLR